ncbi:hypothetical protein HZC09_05020 [Candidatus Micrarchaeota archaeon]|nr:hypothetical protein [Candidatus Micrarchaeota archaeon]
MIEKRKLGLYTYTPSDKLRKLLKNTPGATANLEHLYEPTEELHNEDTRRAFQKAHEQGIDFGGRIWRYLLRLTRDDRNEEQKVEGYPEDAERKFALAFLQHAYEAVPKRNKEKIFGGLSGGGGTGINQFFTFAPYVHHNIAGKAGERESIRVLLKWLEDSIKPDARSGKELADSLIADCKNNRTLAAS